MDPARGRYLNYTRRNTPLKVWVFDDPPRLEISHPISYINRAHSDGFMTDNIKERTILIVDDEKPFRDLVRYELGQEGYSSILEAEDGEEAINLLAEKHVDLILLDLRMPKLAGEDVLRFVRGNHPKISVIVMTGQTENTVKQKILGLGADAYLVKPYDSTELLESICGILEKK